ncbi:Hypothetical protein, conserved [Brucella abortus str. 2308 A]|uniref:Uncharacterized protein n=7 Tax=Brucella TaxID=234 RepID=Q2YIR8_BRUA2|nr:hypothetical protein BRA0004 [Brucella suis 1330]AAX75457.1 hypothetical protein BruAb2_0004 [Brucella abortus bv. 1 str. 9-941]ABX63213.1 Hypothetical protein, conserved [Brucella canis ATCC 23365]ABY39036.1 Hypothetical protein, conserved [Brucella suis ATCC 23445]ACU49146.1 hypothetical protein BMI_II4 [Brucella microti CCM 4915]ADZ67253.1 conserved hypothetical protein [Brucella melitensis M28]ADZ88121.1 conserved hypothetical protein [Brucella melitensis M5-90]AEK55467.1 hypothetical
MRAGLLWQGFLSGFSWVVYENGLAWKFFPFAAMVRQY